MGRGVEGAPWHCAYASGGDFSDRLRPRLARHPPVRNTVGRRSILGQLSDHHARSCLGAHFDPIEIRVKEGECGRSRLGPAKRCGTAIFGKPFAFCFCAVSAPRKRGSDLDRNWYDSRAHKRPHGDWKPASLTSYGIFGGGNKITAVQSLGENHHALLLYTSAEII